MKKRVIAMVLTIALMATSVLYVPQGTYAANSNTKKTGTCYYASEFYGSKDFRLTYYYDDAYFKNSSYDDNKSLATMSMVLTMAGGRSNRATSWSGKAQNIKELWSDLGFSKISVNSDYTSMPTTYSCAIGCASKSLTVDGKNYTLISMNINGFRLFDEWGYCAVCGRNGEHESIRAGADQAYSFLKQYISNNGITGNIKLWLTGYSAGAGKADLLAADLDDGASLGSNVKLAEDDLYAYCFNCPKIALTKNGLNDKVYNNIKVYNYDYVYGVYLALSSYGFGLYGQKHTYPTKNGTSNYSSKLAKMKQMLETINGHPDEFTLDNFKMKEATLSDPYIKDSTKSEKNKDLAEFLDMGVQELADVCAPTRDAWVSDFQTDCSLLLTYMFGGLDENWIEAIDDFMKNVNDDVFTIAMYTVLGMESNLASLYTTELRDAMKKAGVANYDDSMLQKFAQVLAKVIIKIGKKGDLNHGATFIGNMKIILIDSMDATLQLAWLMSEDPYYLNPDSFGQNNSDESVDLSDCTVTLAKKSYVYNGKACKPAVTVKYDGKKLTKNEDYKVSYKNNKNAGTATVTVTGMDQYTGSVKKTFKIKKAEGEVTAKNITKTYSASSRTVAISMESNGNGDITYSSSNSSIKVNSDGEVKIPAKFIGKSTITIEVAASKNYTAASTTMVVKVNPSKTQINSLSNPTAGRVKVDWKKNASASGYQVQISVKKDFSVINARYPDDADNYTKDTTCYFNKVPKGYLVYVRIRTVSVVNGKKYYSGWSTKKSIEVTK